MKWHKEAQIWVIQMRTKKEQREQEIWLGLWAPVVLHFESEILQPNRETETW